MINLPDNLICLWISNVYKHAWETIKYYKMQYNIKNMYSCILVHSFSCHHAHFKKESIVDLQNCVTFQVCKVVIHYLYSLYSIFYHSLLFPKLYHISILFFIHIRLYLFIFYPYFAHHPILPLTRQPYIFFVLYLWVYQFCFIYSFVFHFYYSRSLLTRVCLVKAMVFPVVMYGCENWTIKRVKHQRIDSFELWCWRRFLRVPWTAKRFNKSILKKISPEYSLERLRLKLKLQFFGHPDVKNRLIGKKPDAGKDWRQEEKGKTEDEMVGWDHRLNGHEFE